MAHIDLHTHSCVSQDGEITPSALVEMAHANRVTHLAITDHNRVDANRDALRKGKNLGVAVIPGIEIDCQYREAHLHILGYFIDYENERYRRLWREHAAAKAGNNEKRIRAVQALGFHFDEDALRATMRDGILASVNIADAILTDPRNNDNPNLADFRPGGAKSRNPLVDFCWTYVTKGRPAHVEDANPPLSEAIDIIRATGGLPVLAHPGSSMPDHEEYLPEILAMGVAGVEVYCGYHSPETAAKWHALARANNAPITCGSDFHGRAKPSIAIGVHGGDAHERESMDTLLREAAGLIAHAK